MDDLEYFKATYGLRDCDVILVPYGSRVYGTHSENSDYDYMAIVPENRQADTGTEYNRNVVNIHIYNTRDFQHQLNVHKIHALEAYFHPDNLCSQFPFKLKLDMLRTSISEKASHSFVKAKKKMEIEKDFYIGWKSLFHSLRILMFGIQVAKTGRINDFSEANQYWKEIIESQQYDWGYFKEKYQPIFNNLSTEFKKHAPK